ncbi:hypothetical protein BHM03_00062829, partial [Ensete ventricosum]
HTIVSSHRGTVGGQETLAPKEFICSQPLTVIFHGRLVNHGSAKTPCGRSYIPVFQIRMEKMKEVKRPPL